MANHQHTPDRGPWMQTYGGHAFYLFDPQPQDIHFRDIAHALSLTCRYSGHTRDFYSVAQHACLVAKWMREDGFKPRTYYAALHHDSAEAYTGDITPQLKDILGNFREIEDAVETSVDIYLGIQDRPDLCDDIKEYDLIALATERRDLLSPNFSDEVWGPMAAPREERIIPLLPREAEDLFIQMHKAAVDDKQLEAARLRRLSNVEPYNDERIKHGRATGSGEGVGEANLVTGS